MSVLKDLRFISLIVLVVAAVALIGAPTFLRATSVTVDFVEEGSKCNFNSGDTINQIYSTIITDGESFTKALRNVEAGERVTMVVNGAPFGCEAIEDSSLGIEIRENK